MNRNTSRWVAHLHETDDLWLPHCNARPIFTMNWMTPLASALIGQPVSDVVRDLSEVMQWLLTHIMSPHLCNLSLPSLAQNQNSAGFCQKLLHSRFFQGHYLSVNQIQIRDPLISLGVGTGKAKALMVWELPLRHSLETVIFWFPGGTQRWCLLISYP